MDELGLNSSDLARAVGVTPTAVYNWRNGSVPRTEALTSVSELLGVTKEYLLRGEEEIVGAAFAGAPNGSVAEIVEDAKRRIAAATGYSAERVRLSLEIDTD